MHDVDRNQFGATVLVDEVGQAVEDRLPLINLDATQHMRTMSQHHIRAGIRRAPEQHFLGRWGLVLDAVDTRVTHIVDMQGDEDLIVLALRQHDVVFHRHHIVFE